jgi:hypothetical protein
MTLALLVLAYELVMARYPGGYCSSVTLINGAQRNPVVIGNFAFLALVGSEISVLSRRFSMR